MYYKEIENGKIISINTGGRGEEITEDEYKRLKAEITAIAEWVNRVYADPAQAAQIPADWRENVLRQVEQRKQWEAEAAQADISPEELGRMMMEVL